MTMKLATLLGSAALLFAGTVASASTIRLDLVGNPIPNTTGGLYTYDVVLTTGSTIEVAPINGQTENSRFALYDISGIQAVPLPSFTADAFLGAGNFSLTFTTLVAPISPALGSPTSPDSASFIDIVGTYTGPTLAATGISQNRTGGTLLGQLKFNSLTPFNFASMQAGSYDFSTQLGVHTSYYDTQGPGSGAPGDNFTPTPVASVSGLALLAVMGGMRRQRKA
jgi:hypothetical protein